MNVLRYGCCVLLLVVLVPASYAAESSTTVDIRQAVPVEAHLAILGRHNPERDYQQVYLKQVWKTVQDEELVERITELITSNVPDEQWETAKGAFEEIRGAVEPIDWKSVADCREAVYAQVMEPPFTHHLLLLRLTPDDAADVQAGVINLFELAEERSEGKAPVKKSSEGSVEITSLVLGDELPFRPSVARLDDVVLLSTSEQLIRRSLAMLQGSGEPSKFDDKRLAEALAQLPEPEDALIFFDGQQLFSQLRKIGSFIRSKAPDKPEAERAATLLEQVLSQLDVLDYEVTVQYTDGYRNCAKTLGKLNADPDEKLLGRMVSSGEPFENWQRWIPADAVSYSLSTGVNLHEGYEGVLDFLNEHVPESKEGLEKLEQAQEDIGVHLDRDILQAFSGESVSVTLPAAPSASMGGAQSVLALRCHKPDRIRELLHRLVDGLQQFPAVQAQQITLSECSELEGFDEVSATTLQMVGARPVIGFHDGWMIIGSSPGAVQKVLDTYEGKAPGVADAESFQRFDLAVDGPVVGLSYRNLAESTRQTANGIRQVGLMAPMIIGMAAAQAEPEDLKPVQEALALLPSIANVIDKFDFLEAMLCVTQPSDAPNTYLRRSVTLVRPPAESEGGETVSEDAADEAS